MKNTIFWFITFAIIATVVVVTVIFTQDFGHEKNENKIWVFSGLAVCGEPWQHDLKTSFMYESDQILHYYERQNIEIYDIKIYIETGTSRLEDTCFLGDRLYLLVDESDAKHLLNSRFHIAEGNVPLQLD